MHQQVTAAVRSEDAAAAAAEGGALIIGTAAVGTL